jgi:hypothetical protein
MFLKKNGSWGDRQGNEELIESLVRKSKESSKDFGWILVIRTVISE